jgi:formylglycine-generating enzyme required for sulfatase activity
MSRYVIFLGVLNFITLCSVALAQDVSLAVSTFDNARANPKLGIIPQRVLFKNTFQNSLGQTFLTVAPGKFFMGASENDPEIQNDENQVEIEFSKAYSIAATEVTQLQWFRLMKSKPWLDFSELSENNNLPATGMTWFEAVAFCDKLSARERKHYRLPTEAEWEYACRGGSQKTHESLTTLEHTAWFREAGQSKADCFLHVVGRKQGNAFQLFDLQGNAWEWCSDWYYERLFSGVNVTGPVEGKAKVFRGGSTQSTAFQCRAAYREAGVPEFTASMLGFRVVLETE